MGRVQATRLVFQDRPLLGQMAIATVLVGSAAALSSAVIAVPVSQVGYAKGAARQAPANTPITPAVVAAPAPAGLRISTPLRELAPVSTLAKTAEPTRIEPPRTAPLVLTAASRISAISSRFELAALPVEAPLAAPAMVPAPLAAPGAAPVSLAASTVPPVSAVAALGEEVKLVPPATPLRLINPPELRGFDLARISATPKAVPAGFAKPAARSATSGKVEGLGKKDTVVGDTVFHQVTLSVAGSDGKAIDVRIGADMKPSLKVGDLLGLVSDRMDPDSAARFAAAASAGDYVSLATLRATGFEVAYNAGTDSISISVSP